ncbi:hypothetical protein ruthe_01576 [Rubellimicrobium thermophilum DSM 16684]|uniref:Uncharacterized protein n=1 Tax=Rubellimicrobium thermophilum DSM 16684 TaxID=1123069 RepID=S9S6M8_9RHOB|nr:hypothetical protein ruthe_01576 [Rubellimicrobium thermophilum DSM 16684]
MRLTRRHAAFGLAAAMVGPALPLRAQTGPLRIDITQGVIEPIPFAIRPLPRPRRAGRRRWPRRSRR